MFESEEWRTIKWEVILDILVISTSFVSYFELLQQIIKKFTITPHLFQHYSPHTEPTTNEHRRRKDSNNNTQKTWFSQHCNHSYRIPYLQWLLLPKYL